MLRHLHAGNVGRRFRLSLFVRVRPMAICKGTEVVINKGVTEACPIFNLGPYLKLAKLSLDLNSMEFIFHKLHFYKTRLCLCNKNTPLSYTSAREHLFFYLRSCGHDPKLFGLHSFHSSGATVAANNGVCDRLFKKYGWWSSDRAQDGYVPEDQKVRLSVTAKLNLERVPFPLSGKFQYAPYNYLPNGAGSEQTLRCRSHLVPPERSKTENN